MKTYYIVKHGDTDGMKYWEAHRRGLWSSLNIFSILNYVLGTVTYESADDCEARLRRAVHPKKPQVVRVVRI